MKRLWLFFTISLLLTTQSIGQATGSAMAKVYESYLSDDLKSWESGISTLAQTYRKSPTGRALYELTLAQYGLLGAYITKGGKYKDPADVLLGRAEENAQKLLQYSDYQSEAHAFLGAIISLRIEQSPMKGMLLASKSQEYTAQSLELGPEKPGGWVEKGNLRFHAPRLFGGDNEEAIACYEQAIQLFDEQPELKANNWLYLHALAWLGQAYEKSGQAEKALEAYRKALIYAPNFRLVRDDFLPKLKAKLRQ